MAISWKESYCTGVRQIDEQHQKLFRFASTLDRLVDEGSGSGPELDHLLMFLEGYARSHFAYEEPCMARLRCPTARANKKAHREFLEFYDVILNEYRTCGGSLDLVRQLRNWLNKWLVDHICSIDMGLRDCIRKPGES